MNCAAGNNNILRRWPPQMLESFAARRLRGLPGLDPDH